MVAIIRHEKTRIMGFLWLELPVFICPQRNDRRLMNRKQKRSKEAEINLVGFPKASCSLLERRPWHVSCFSHLSHIPHSITF